MSNPHAQWCANRFISYRASDNTFQPFNGPRRQCVSPFGS
ncbi:BA14K family protein [Pseudaminobacter soli (ex Li et al. 2025)]